MRLPYLQVAQETWPLSRELGALLGVSAREARGLLLDLWAWAVDLGPSDEPPQGLCLGARVSQRLAGALEWEGDPEILLGALCDVGGGLVERVEGGIRVRGLDRYHKAWEAAERGRQRKAAWRERKEIRRNGDGTGTERGQDAEECRKTQTQTQTQIEAVNTLAGTSGAPPAGESVGAKSDTGKKQKPPPDPRLTGVRDMLVRAFEDTRGSKYAYGGAKDTEAVKRLLPLGDDAEIELRWRFALQSVGFHRSDSIAQFASKWNSYGGDTGPPNKPKQDVTRGYVRAETQDHSGGLDF